MSPETTLPSPLPNSVNTLSTPSAVAINGNVYVFTRGFGNDQNLYVTIGSPQGWGGPRAISPIVHSSAAPAAALSADGTMYVVYKGQDSDEWIYAVKSTDGAAWSGSKFPDSANTSTGPGAVIENGSLYAVYKGAGNDAFVYVAEMSANATWQPV
jgi:hypothetical protein